jgi:hypothetical protein
LDSLDFAPSAVEAAAAAFVKSQERAGAGACVVGEFATD